MKRTMSKVVLVSVVVALLMGAQPVSGQLATAQKLSITDLGTLPGGGYSVASGINSRGQVVGDSKGHAVLWHR
jgi:uncharacterized membrane protein